MITYTMTPDEKTVRAMARIYRKKNKAYDIRWRKLLLGCILSLVVIAMSVTGMALTNYGEAYWIAFFAVGAGIFCLAVYLTVSTGRQVYQEIAKEGMLVKNQQQTYVFGEEIRIDAGDNSSILFWDMIEEWGEIGHFLYIRFEDSFLLLDKNKMKRQEVDEILKKLQ